MSDALDVAFRRLGKSSEGLGFIDTVETRYRVWHDDDALPVRRERKTSEKRAATVPFAGPASFDDETTAGKCPRAHCRATSTTHDGRKLGHIRLDVEEFGKRTSH